ncbi:response regulator [Myxococcota bacterium]|nr:response regulator [Myxococcota bacterium]MBU1496101.1 response regulator [Myxococcota bacterium]
MKMLIVEDEFASSAMLEFFLEPFGQVDIAVSGANAIDLLQKSFSENDRYMLLCIDIGLPDINGQDLLEKLRKFESESGISIQERSIVFMTTAQGDPKNVSKAFYNQCDEYILKPVRKSELIRLFIKYNFLTELANSIPSPEN